MSDQHAPKRPAPFDTTHEFISPLISNVTRDPIFQESGLNYTTWRSYTPLCAFDTSTRPQKEFEFRCNELK